MEYRFTIEYNGSGVIAEEPRNWADFESELDRDFDTHGAVFQFTSGVLKLGFVGEARDLLETAFRADGYDADVTLTVEEREDEFNAYRQIFYGSALFENRNYNRDFFEVDFEESGFKQKLKNRFKTKVKLDTDIDLDGNPLTESLQSYTTVWDTLRFFNTWKVGYKTSLDPDDFDYLIDSINDTKIVGTEVETRYTDLNWEKTLQNSLEEPQTTPTSALSSSVPDPILICKTAGTLTFTYNIHWVSIVSASVGITTTQTVAIENTIKLVHTDSGDSPVGAGTYTIFLKQTSAAINNVSSPLEYITPTSQISGFFDIEGVSVDDKFRFYIEQKVSLSGQATSYTINYQLFMYGDSTIEFKVLTDSVEVPVKHWLIYDVIRHIVQITTGQADAFDSNFLKGLEHGAISDGCGALNMLTNGYQLRGIDNSLEVSLSDIVEHLSCEYGTGIGFTNVYGQYRFVLELMEYFYQDNEILDLGNPVNLDENESYSEEAFEPLMINNIKIGYKKYSEDEDIAENIRDFLTEAEYQTPVASIEGTYSKISPLIASGRLIQATFDARQDLTKTWKYDESVFIVYGQRNLYGVVPENNEPFESIGGLDDPDTAYNIRKAPVFMFLNHALLINSACYGKADTAIIQNVSSEISKTFNATYSSYASCVLSDTQRLQRSSTGNITIENNYEGLRLWNPVMHKLTVAMSDEQYDEIVRSMEGNNTGKNYGYLTYRDEKGNTKQGFPINIKRSPIKKMAMIETVEFADYQNYNPAPTPPPVDNSFEVSAATYSQTLSVISSVFDLFFSSDGLNMFLKANSEVRKYTLSTAWDVSTGSPSTQFITTLSGDYGIFFKQDGLKMYVVDQGTPDILEYGLSPAWDISSPTLNYTQGITLTPFETNLYGLVFKPDGTKFYVTGGNNDRVWECNCWIPWDVQTYYEVQSLDVSSQDTSVTGLSFNNDGTKMYLTGSLNDRIYQYNLGTAWDISTAVYDQFLDISAYGAICAGTFWKPDGSKLYLADFTNEDVIEFDV